MHGPQPRTRRRRYATRLPAPERREQLLEAALVVLAERGYRGLTMEAVARRAGVTKPVVYDAFANRDAIMRTLLDAEEERVVAELLDALGPVPTGEPGGSVAAAAAMGDALGRALAVVAARPQAYRLLLLQAAGAPPAVRARIDEGRSKVTARVQAILEQALDDPAADAELLAIAVLALAESAATLMLSDPARFPVARFQRGLAQLLAVPTAR